MMNFDFALGAQHPVILPVEEDSDLRGCEVVASDQTSLGMVTEVYGSKQTDMVAYVEVMTNESPTKVLMLPWENLVWESDGNLKIRGRAQEILNMPAYQEQAVWRTWGHQLVTYDELIRAALTKESDWLETA